MRVLRGRSDDPTTDREITNEMASRTASTGEEALRVWQPPRQVAFGRRDTQAAGYQAAREAALEHAFPPTERQTGGHAVAYTGTGVSVALCQPVDDIRTGIGDRYESTTETLQRALWRLSVPADRGEPDGAFCPGDHSLQYNGKIAGIAQHVSKDVAVVGAVVIVRDHDIISDVLSPIYAALGVPFSKDAVGSIDRAGGETTAETVCETIENAFVADSEVVVEHVG